MPVITDAQALTQEQLIFRSRLQLVLKQYYIGFVVNIGVAAAVTYVLWPAVTPDRLLAWFALMVITNVGRVIFVQRSLRVLDQLNADELNGHYRRYLIAVVISGLLWGLLGSLLFPVGSPLHQGFVMVVMAAMLSGAVAIMYPLHRLYYAFAIPMLVPVLISLYLQSEVIQMSLAVLAFIYLAAMMLITRRAEATLIKTIRMQYLNSELLEQLSTMSEHLRNARDRLEQRVAERTTALSRLNENLNAEIEERKRIEEELFNQKEAAEITLRSIAEGIVTTDAVGNVVYVNERAEQILDCKLQEVRGKYFHDAVTLIDEETLQRVEDKIEMAIRNRCVVVDPMRYLVGNHAVTGTAVRMSIAPIFSQMQELIGLIIVMNDVTRERLHQLQLAHIATHDSLTGLHNRYAFEQHLDRLEATQELVSGVAAVVYIDLDHFKLVNDSCGHHAGDELLRQLSELLAMQIDATDMLARIGGDEFGAIIHAPDREQIEAKADKLLKTIRSYRFAWLERTFSVGASLGMVILDEHIVNIRDSLRYADMACFIAKEKGGTQIHIYVAQDEEMLARHNEINRVTQLSEAMEQNGLVLYKQEILRIDGRGRGQHYEVLLRLRNSHGEIILPGAFISAAERYHFMQDVDRWVIGKVFELAENNGICGDAQSCTVNINLSGLSLVNEKMLDYISARLREGVVPGRMLCFEITETTAITNLSKAIAFIEELKKYDCQFAIDDFGIGVSSLGYLKNLPVDYVKIDGSFIRDIDNDAIDYAMVESIHKVVSLSGKQTIAEYVESDAILKLLEQMGVEYAQGHAIARPSLWLDTVKAEQTVSA